jgi:hypothetical protein
MVQANLFLGFWFLVVSEFPETLSPLPLPSGFTQVSAKMTSDSAVIAAGHFLRADI